MRSREEIDQAVTNNKLVMKSDFFKAGLVELYPFVDADKIPEMHRKAMDKDVLDDWDPEEEIANFSFTDSAKNEIEYLEKLVDNDEVNAAVFRTPRLLAIIWLYGDEITKYDNQLFKLVTGHLSLNKAANELKKMYKKIRTVYNIN